MDRSQKLVILIFFVSLIFIINACHKARAVDETIQASVKISVCGNLIIEGGEDCEGIDLNGQTCEGLGYLSGTLVCDTACSFDTTHCLPMPTATPTPTSTPTPTPTITPTPTTAPTSTPGPAATSTPAIVLTPTIIPTTIIKPTPIPEILQTIISLFKLNLYNISQNGKIETKEFISVVKQWVGNWRGTEKEKSAFKICDLNNDEKCDAVDFSVLLYYIREI